MSTIVVSPLSPPEESTFEVIQLEIYVKNSDFVGFFDLLEVWRSRDTETGPYEELTAETWRAARVPGWAGDLPASPVTGGYAAVVGLDLQFKVNLTDSLVVTFTGTNPLTFAAAAAQISSQSAGRLTSYVDEDGRLVVETVDAGVGAVLQVEGGEAAPALGLPVTEPESLVYGRDARVQLRTGQEVYRFSDIRGSGRYYYKTRFRNRLTGAVSDFSQAFSATQTIGVSETNLAVGYVCLVALDGRPLINREVRVHSNFNGLLVEGKVMAGLDAVKLTDETGYVEFTMVRGQAVTVAIAGTDLVRDITVPTDLSIRTFNLMDPTISGPDIFKVQVPDIVYAERRSF